ncbi:MAG: glycoside hydrolase family 3 protein [Actinomycetota bacterium]|nr:glycoside hydrolase family 3 protein [Actinomycetota bacterium]
MSREQRVGQLFMVGLSAGAGPSSLDAILRDQHVGGVVLLGTWTGSASVAAATTHLQEVAKASAGIRVLVSADQEGGQVQHLRGNGFTGAPAALTQGRDPAAAGGTAARTGRELAAAGVNVDLAPVADVVAAGFARQNAPIGAYQREFGNDPATVSRAVTAVVAGLQGSGVSATLKHFPGLGRVTGNTDFTTVGTTDEVTTATDAWLQPFRDGIAAGADLVMVSSALYPRIDRTNRAVFSTAVIDGVLRGNLGYAGVVVTDDVGAARAVAAVPVDERATRFIAAGGDVVLTGLASTVPPMATAVSQRVADDATFAAQVDASVHRVMALKVKRGLATCS